MKAFKMLTLRNKLCLFMLILSSQAVWAQGRLLVPYRSGELYGFMDTLGNVVIAPKYEEVQDMNFYYDTVAMQANALYSVKQNGVLKVINNNENDVFLPQEKYDSIYSVMMVKDRFITQKSGKYGFILRNKPIIPCIYDDILPHYNYSCLVRKGRFVGMIDQDGTIKIPPVYSDIEFAGFTDSSVVWIAKGALTEEYIEDKRTEFIDYGEGTKYSNYDNNLERIVDMMVEDFGNRITALKDKYDKVKEMYDIEGWYYISKNGLWGLYDWNKQKEIIKPQYDDIDFMYNEYNRIYLRVESEDHYGIINQYNEILVPVTMDRIRDLDNKNVAFLQKNKKYGAFVAGTVYPYIAPNYDTISLDNYIIANKHWSFYLFKVLQDDNVFYVGENGIEFRVR